MRIVRYTGLAGPAVGYVEDDHVVPVADRADTATVLDLAMAVNTDPSLRPAPVGAAVPLVDVRLLAPVGEVASLRDFYAFEQHVATARMGRGAEMDAGWYDLPVFYFSNPAAVVGPDDDVPVQPRSEAMDYELEVAVVLGRGGSGVGLADADALVAGFTVMNDWSARDVQREEMRQGLGPAKGKDFATSLGPWLVTADEFAPGGLRDVPHAQMTARVNGVEYSRADLADLWWSFAEMVVYAAEGTALRRGDVLGSGTCGTGCVLELSLTHGPDRYPWLRPGDLVELEVAGLGSLRNRLVPAASPPFAPDPRRVRPVLSSPPQGRPPALRPTL